MTSKEFWRDTAERAIRTFLQTFAAMFSAGGLGLLDAPWVTALSTAGMAALLSVINSVLASPFGRENSASVLSDPVRRDLPRRQGTDAAADETVGAGR
ncbi:hypothetical protein Lesp02_37750 [Lentzea sp. NBRC 105346]|uniref:holin n=1 Tax=Lentzea sp. NBRC 105346 TaxID=3032205 RepID=UPI0024A5BD95|nr:holin [Lentzea sp. NBRC 105346]GLZ31587.1 hypothetical protein Lesp02_37750 [Lentzea sp. NBRC 105346]